MEYFSYFCNMITNLPTYDEARKAIRGGKDPMAFLHLGILYAQGIGVTQNHILAHYFLKKALDMGCPEAEEYINMLYEYGEKDFAADIESYISDDSSISRETIAKLRARIDVERKAKHYGHLSKIRKHLALIYPEYNREKAIEDILNGRDTMDADILYSTSTLDNKSEIFLELQERLLSQLYAHVESDDDMWEHIDTDALGKDESELAQCIVNLTFSYDNICKKYNVERKDIYDLESLGLYPYIKIQTMVTLRQQGFRCLLSIKDIDPIINDEFIEKLDDDQALLDVCEKIKDQDLQLFLISFVELNIDLDSLEITSLSLLRSYRNNDLAPLVEHINAFVDRLNKAGIKNHLPFYTIELLPPIDLSKDHVDSNKATSNNDMIHSGNDITGTDKDDQFERPLSNKVGVKGRYSILQNDKGEIIVIIEAREGEPDDPRFIYDGSTALLFRNFDSNVIFRDIDPKAHEALGNVTEVLVVEILNDVVREYIVPLRRVKDVNSLII